MSSPPPSDPSTSAAPKPPPRRPDPNIQRDNSQYFRPGTSEIYRTWNAKTLPERAHLPKIDERCWFYCTQSVHDRLNAKRPVCYTLCWRRAFPHESHQLAKTPQAMTWSEYWALESRTRPETQIAKEWAPLAGRYIYFSKGRDAATLHMVSMKGSGTPSPINYYAPGKVPAAPTSDKSTSSASQPTSKPAGKDAPQSETYEKVIALGPLPYEIADGVRAGFDKFFGPTGRLLSKSTKLWDDGVPIRVAKSMYELAVAGEPLALANKAVDLIIRASRGGGSGPDDTSL